MENDLICTQRNFFVSHLHAAFRYVSKYKPMYSLTYLMTKIYQPTYAHIISHNTLLKLFKTLRHVSILSGHHQGALFLAKVIL